MILGYLVSSPEGVLGTVEGCARDADGRPTTLILTQGLLGRRRFEVPVQALVRVDHHRELALVTHGTAPARDTHSGILQRFLEFGARLVDVDGRNAFARREARSPVLCEITCHERCLVLGSVAAALARQLAAPLLITRGCMPASDENTEPARQARIAQESECFIDLLLSPTSQGIEIGRAVWNDPPETLADLADEIGAALLVVDAANHSLPDAAPLHFDTSSAAHCPVVVVPAHMPPWTLSDS